MQPSDHCLAVVLKRQIWREMDLRLLCLTVPFGLIEVYAFGAGSQRSNRGQLAQPFNLLDVDLQVRNRPRSAGYSQEKIISAPFQQNSYQLTDAKLLKASQLSYQTDDMVLGSASYVNQWLEALSVYLETSVDQLYQLVSYYDALAECSGIPERNHRLSLCLRRFELDLLKWIGFDLAQLIQQQCPMQSHSSESSQVLLNYVFDIQQGWITETSQGDYGLPQQILDDLQVLFIHDDFATVSLARLKRHNQHVLSQLKQGMSNR